MSLGRPIAVVDIGSNSVRLVAYEGLTRAPTPLFNEKVMAGLGRNVASTGRLPDDGVSEAFQALKRFRALCGLMKIDDIRVLATAAARDAQNGPQFLAEAERLIGQKIELISGRREAELSALGVVSGFHKPDGMVGDLGGGSLELVDVGGGRIGQGRSLRIGGLALLDLSARSLKRASRIVREALEEVPAPPGTARRPFYAIGGTWRAFAKLHMRAVGYPLNVMHGYAIPVAEAIAFCRTLQQADVETIPSIGAIASNRRQLLPYGALVLEQVLKKMRSDRLVFSMLGVREGLLYDLLDEDEKRRDPLLAAARELNTLRSRSPRHGEDLTLWSDRLLASCQFDETEDERRLRHAACLLADIGWRAHPDYRGEQSLNIIANAAFVGLDHPGRAYLALAVFFRHSGPSEDDLSPRLKEMATPRLLERARLLGSIMRVAYIISAAMPDVLPRSPLVLDQGKLVLRLPSELEALAGDRLNSRLRQLGKLLGKETLVTVNP